MLSINYVEDKLINYVLYMQEKYEFKIEDWDLMWGEFKYVNYKLISLFLCY